MSDAAQDSRKHWREKIPGWIGAAIIFAGFYGIAVWLGGSWRMGGYFIGGLVASVLLLAAIAALLLFAMRRVVRAANRRLPTRSGMASPICTAGKSSPIGPRGTRRGCDVYADDLPSAGNGSSRSEERGSRQAGKCIPSGRPGFDSNTQPNQ